MKITRASDFAIRILVRLAESKSKLTSEKIAREIEVPFSHVAKIVQSLSRNGFIASSKGKNGGLRLAQDPQKIDLSKVIQAVEGPFVLSDCILNKGVCGFSHGCKVRKCLGQVRSEMIKVLAKTNIYDLAFSNN